MTLKQLAGAVLLIACASIPLAAQPQAPVPSAAVDADSDVVHLDVSVVDAAGRPVRGLTAADFEVTRDGVPVAVAGVTSFGRPSNEGSRPATPAVRGRLEPSQVAYDVLRNDDVIDRYVTIVLDDMSVGGQADAGNWTGTVGLDMARALIDQLGPDDRGAVYFTFMGRQQGLTSDPVLLRAAVDRFEDRFEIRRAEVQDCAGGADRAFCVVDTLQRVVEALPSMPLQRRLIVYISGGATLPVVDVSASGGSGAVRRLVAALQRSNVVVHSITPAGLAAATAGDAAVDLAAATGGGALVDTMIGTGFGAILDAVGSYYFVALPRGASGDQFHSVRVTVRRPGLSVRTRAGYFGAGVVVAPAVDPVLTRIEAALAAPSPSGALPMGASVAVFGVPGRREAVVSVATAVTAAAAPGVASWTAEIASTAFDPQWRPRAAHRQTIEVTTRAGAGPQTVDAIAALELLPGRYELRVAAVSGEKAGSVFIPVDVPEFLNLPLSASGLVVTTSSSPYRESPLLAGTVPVTPTTRRLFSSAETAEVFIRFYQGGRSRIRNMPVSLRIADARGEGIIQGTEVVQPGQFTAARSTDWRFSLPLARLAAGEYLLTVEAELDDQRETRHLRFTVMK